MSAKKPHIAVDPVKHRQTSHWDEDLLGHQQLAQLYQQGREQRRRYKRRQFAWIGFWLLLLCLHPTLIYWLQRLL